MGRLDPAAALERVHGDVELGGLIADGLPFGASGDGSSPKFAGAEIVEDGGHAAYMVGVGVGHGDDIKSPNPAIPKIGGDDVFADIDFGSGVAAKGKDAAAPKH